MPDRRAPARRSRALPPPSRRLAEDLGRARGKPFRALARVISRLAVRTAAVAAPESSVGASLLRELPWNGEHGYGRVAHELFGDAAEEQVREPRASFGAHDDEVVISGPELLEQRGGGSARDQPARPGDAARQVERVEKLLHLELGVLANELAEWPLFGTVANEDGVRDVRGPVPNVDDVERCAQ